MTQDEPAAVPTPIQCLRMMVDEAGSQKAIALRLKVSQQYLGDVLKGVRPVSASLARKLGYQRYIGYMLLPADE